MKRDRLFERARKALCNPFTLGLFVALLLVVSGTGLYHAGASNASHKAGAATTALPQVPPRPWTAVASTGAIDESSLPDFVFGTGAATPSALGFKPNSHAMALQARYNVTNTFDNNANANIPNWTTLELVAEAPNNSTVTAALYRIERCTGKVLSSNPNQPFDPLCSVQITNSAVSICRTCAFNAALVDFSQYFYFVDVTFTRPNVQRRPIAYALRVY